MLLNKYYSVSLKNKYKALLTNKLQTKQQCFNNLGKQKVEVGK